MSVENMDEKQMKMHEDSIKVIKSRNTALYRENTRLKKQLSDETQRVAELEEKLGNLVKTRTEAIKSESKTQVLPSDMLRNSASKLCEACKIQLRRNVTQESGIFITKSELEKLDQDVQTLRNALAMKELAWSQSAEREKNYYQQLTRLAQDVISANQLADNRYNELDTMARQLETFDGDEGERKRIESPAENNSQQSEEEKKTEHQKLLIMANNFVDGN